MAKILLVEDDALTAEQVLDNLRFDGHTVDWVADGNEGFHRLRFYTFDLAILDWSLPGKSGFEICRDYRANGGTIPIIMLTAVSNIENKVDAFQSGADDYLTKPFALAELCARVTAIARRPKDRTNDLLTLGDLTLDRKSRKAVRNEREIQLLPKEFVVLEFLMERPNTLFTAAELLERLWSSESESTEDAVRQCMARLRRKVDAQMDEQKLLVAQKGYGYKISVS